MYPHNAECSAAGRDGSRSRNASVPTVATTATTVSSATTQPASNRTKSTRRVWASSGPRQALTPNLAHLSEISIAGRLVMPARSLSGERHMAVRRIAATVLAAAITIAPAAGAAPATARRAAVEPVVIAVIGETGLNPLHTDFATVDGRAPRLPSGMPPTTPIWMPRAGSFEERLAELRSGPLAALPRNELFSISGTRIIGVIDPIDADAAVPRHDLLADRMHGTGVLGAAGGLRHGTAPDALLVFVVGSQRQS